MGRARRGQPLAGISGFVTHPSSPFPGIIAGWPTREVEAPSPPSPPLTEVEERREGVFDVARGGEAAPHNAPV